MNICLNILREPNIFFTASGFLAAISVFLAQLEAHTHQMYGTKASKQFTVGLSFLWTFLTILAALAAFARGAWSSNGINDKIDECAIALFWLSLFMAVTDIVVAIVATFLKVLLDISLSEPPITAPKSLEKKLVWFLLLLLAVLGLFLISDAWTRGLWRWYFWVGTALLVPVGIFVWQELGFWSQIWSQMRRVWRRILWWIRRV